MEEQRVYTQGEVIDIVRTVQNLQSLDRLFRTADLERERFIMLQRAERATRYYHVTKISSEEAYRKALEKGDKKIEQLKVILQRTIEDYNALPESMRRTLGDMCNLDPDKIAIHLL